MTLSQILAFGTVAISVIGAEVDTYNRPKAEGPGVYDPRQKSDMDALASVAETAAFNAKLTGNWTVFTEDRAHSVRRFTVLPQRWLTGPFTGGFKGDARPGEFYVFQIVPYAAKLALGDLRVTFTDLKGTAGAIPAARLRCLSLGGNDFHGQPFTKNISISQSRLQPLWIGVDLARETRAGKYAGTATVACSAGKLTVPVELNVTGAPLDDHGDGDSWRLSRLRWLDSTIGLDDNTVTAPFTPIVRDAKTLQVLGRDLVLGEDGLPRQIRSFFSASNTSIGKQPTRELLAAPCRFVVETDAGPMKFAPVTFHFVTESKGTVRWVADSRAQDIALEVTGRLEYDGFSDFRCRIKAAAPVKVKDIRLEVDVAPGADSYFMGLGKAGGKAPESVDWKWNATVNQDGFWIGAVNGGFKLQLYGANWRTPLINAYYHWRELLVPESWGTGGMRLNKTATGTKAVAYTGPRELVTGKPVDFNFKMFLTPFKPLNTDQQWALRYFHPHQGQGDPIFYHGDKIKALGANVINIHHNQEPNPTINYPYFDLSMPLLRKAVASAHANGVKVKIYYTLRELTSNLPELFAFFSMNGELICPSSGKDGVNARPVTNSGGPHPWLVEHLGSEGYIPAWRETIGGRYGGLLDLAILTTPDSRLCNFYLEGLAFTLRETGFDGMYIDDTSLDRKTFQRAHRIFEKAGKPLLVDMHSWSHNNGMAGNTPSAYVFMQNYPYYHRLWHGEGFNCNVPVDNMLIEQSGIPFGLMSEMLDHPNVWHGMVFGETARLGWSGDPRPMWKFWDEFGMAGTEMIGFWDSVCPVKSGKENLPVTIYRKPGKTLVAIASWSGKKETVKLSIDWRALGLDPAKASFSAPAIDGFQQETAFAVNTAIPVAPGKGWLLVLDETPRTIPESTFEDPLRGLTIKAADETPFEINVPANTVKTKDIAWQKDAAVAVARINPLKDAGQSWGVGLAVGWPDGRSVQINARTDGRWGLRKNGAELFAGEHAPGQPATLAVKLTDKTVQLYAKEDDSTDWELLTEFPRAEFPGLPATIRIGKIGATWSPANFPDAGTTAPCRVEWVKQF